MWCNIEANAFESFKKILFYQNLAVAFFDVSDFCRIKYFEFREIFGEQQCIKPAKLHFVIIFIWFWSKFCFSQLLYHWFGIRFCNKTGTFMLSRRKIFLGIAYRYQCQDRLNCSQNKSKFLQTWCVKPYSHIFSIAAGKF